MRKRREGIKYLTYLNVRTSWMTPNLSSHENLKNENLKDMEKLKGRNVGIVIRSSKETLELTKLHSYGEV